MDNRQRTVLEWIRDQWEDLLLSLAILAVRRLGFDRLYIVAADDWDQYMEDPAC